MTELKNCLFCEMQAAILMKVMKVLKNIGSRPCQAPAWKIASCGACCSCIAKKAIDEIEKR